MFILKREKQGDVMGRCKWEKWNISQTVNFVALPLPSELTSEVFTCATMSLTTCPIPQLILPLAL